VQSLAVVVGVDLAAGQSLSQQFLDARPRCWSRWPGRRSRATATTATSAQKPNTPSVITSHAHPLME
jgi:hypothetical protein